MSDSENKGKFRRFKTLIGSASFALILSVIIFLYQEISTKRDFIRVVDNLSQIENSLSTRYLGIFPEYIKNINALLEDVILHQEANGKCDSVVIFEDVLYYGIISDSQGFKTMMQNLLTISNNGSHITIAYYDVNGRPFKQMVKDELISNKYQEYYQRDVRRYFNALNNLRNEVKEVRGTIPKDKVRSTMQNLIEKHFNKFCIEYTTNRYDRYKLMSQFSDYRVIEPLICQRYFDSTKVNDIEGFKKSIGLMLRKLPYDDKVANKVEERVNKLLKDLDLIKESYLKKDINEITYADYENTYRDLSLAIIEMLSENSNIEMLPMDESLMMSCWMCNEKGKGKAIFAFPSKYSTDEIGFMSQDAAFIRYIQTMLNGVKSRLSIKHQ